MTCDLVPGAIVARAREPEGLRTMMMVSSVAHAAAIAALATAPWVLGPHHRAEAMLMQISFPGDVQALPLGPRPEELVEHVTKPAPVPVAMQRASSTAKPAPPITGPEWHRAPSRPDAEQRSSSESGLSMGVLPGMNARSTNVDFCEPQYLGQMVSLIHRNWQPNQNVGGKPIVRFVILRDGSLTGITLRQPSGYPGLDLEAMRAITLTRAIPPLPACYPHSHYAMNLTFEYIR